MGHEWNAFMEGDLYLVEDLWNIHSVDFKLEPFYGTVKMRQLGWLSAPTRSDG